MDNNRTQNGKNPSSAAHAKARQNACVSVCRTRYRSSGIMLRVCLINCWVNCCLSMQALGLGLSSDLDGLDHVAFQNLVDVVHPFNDTGEHGVIVVETKIVDEVYEDLSVSG